MIPRRNPIILEERNHQKNSVTRMGLDFVPHVDATVAGRERRKRRSRGSAHHDPAATLGSLPTMTGPVTPPAEAPLDTRERAKSRGVKDGNDTGVAGESEASWGATNGWC